MFFILFIVMFSLMSIFNIKIIGVGLIMVIVWYGSIIMTPKKYVPEVTDE